jgi:uncharacterized Zn finger protein
MASVADLVQEPAIRALVGDDVVFDAGRELAESGAVTLGELTAERVTASVEGEPPCHVELLATDHGLSWSGTCPVALRAIPCRHLAAAAAATTRGARRGPSSP